MKKFCLIAFAFVYALMSISCVKTVDIYDLGDEAYVDMGVSVKWASFNYGASSPEESGTFMNFDNAAGLAPTKEQFEELMANTTWVRASLNGVKGALVTSKTTGKRLFFPASGSIYEGKETNGYVGEGCYWTSTQKDTDQAYYFFFSCINQSGKPDERILSYDKKWTHPVRQVQ